MNRTPLWLPLAILGLLLDVSAVLVFQFWPPPFGPLYLAVLVVGTLGLLLLLIGIQRATPREQP